MSALALTEVIDDHVLQRYRELLDAEDAAFDELRLNLHALILGDAYQHRADPYALGPLLASAILWATTIIFSVTMLALGQTAGSNLVAESLWKISFSTALQTAPPG